MNFLNKILDQHVDKLLAFAALIFFTCVILVIAKWYPGDTVLMQALLSSEGTVIGVFATLLTGQALKNRQEQKTEQNPEQK